MTAIDSVGEYDLHVCRMCGGTGGDPDEYGYPMGCIGCHGTGEVRVYVPGDDDDESTEPSR